MRVVEKVGYAANPRTSLRYQATLAENSKGRVDKRRLEVPLFRSQKAKEAAILTEEEELKLRRRREGTAEAMEETLKWFRRVEIQYSKFGVEDFDFG